LREERLKKRNEIREVFDRGKRIGGRGAKLFVLKNNLPHSRICFTFPRGFGTAVKRNRARRLGREAYRNLKSRLRCGYDLILLVYPEETQTLAGRMGQLQFLFTRAGLL
jgi:ribonuclease P protein component